MNDEREKRKKAFVGFAGFGCVDLALREYGFDVVAVELDPAIAMVNDVNGGNVIIANLLNVDFEGMYFTIGHFSPPCPHFSAARNSNAHQTIRTRISNLAHHQSITNGETEIDLNLAHKICEFIRVVRPMYFTLENVWGYRKSLSWIAIWYTLIEEGYGVGAWNLNSADYGVPQSRRRMVVIARRDGRKPAKPFPTHSAKPDFFTVPHVGWYEAIEDLINTLPESEFAPWQLERLPEEVKTILVMTARTSFGERTGVLDIQKPASTVMASFTAMPRAFLVDGTGVNWFRARDQSEPSMTIKASQHKGIGRAFIVGGQYQSERVVQNRNGDCPVWTITASEHGDTRSYVGGKTVSMTPRALARFQDFPDWFVLPENRKLACRGIGNALPPGLYRAVLKSLDLEMK